MKKAIHSLSIAALIPAAFWLAGYDFNERGEQALLCFLLFCVTAFAVYVYPEDNER